jgi:hypothetical protein
MKKLLLPLFILISSLVYGQVPNQINYQAVARNSVGNVLPNKKITVRLSIRDVSGTGTVLYKETRTITTNNFGLFNVAIGSAGADNTTGTISGIDWGSAAKFIQVEIDPDGGSNFINMGAAQLLAVPYALYAGSSGTSTLTGTAGGALTGTYPNPSIANGVITQSMIASGVIPTSLPPDGNAGGDLTGTYPNPTINNGAITTTKLADNAVTTSKLADASVTIAKLAAGIIPTSLPPNGNAGGDLNGSYPNPTINNGAITTNKLADNAVTTSKVVDGSITMAKLGPDVILGSGGSPIGPAGGDLSGSYPNPTINNGVIITTKLANNAVTTPKIADGSVTSAKLAAGVIPTSLPPSGTAGGDLTGSYPNPTINNGVIITTKLADNSVTTSKIVDASVTSAKLAAGVIPTSLPPSGTAGGDLIGSYPNPTINNGVITTTKLADGAITNIKVADNAITTSKVVDGSITMAKLGPDVIFGSGGSPSGPAGGDLSGTYPNPNLASGSVTTPKIANGSIVTPKLADDAVTTNKLADNSVTTSKIVDASVTSAKLAAGVIPTSLPPNGTAGGDLNGFYPNPTLNKIQGVSVTTTGATIGQVLKFDGTSWIPGADNTGSGGSNPTGPAGGDLTGSYPNPTINNAVITTAKLADNSVTTSKIVDASVTSAKLAAGIIPTSLPPNGTAGGDLTGSYPNPTINNAVITTAKLADNSVTTSKIADASVTSAKLAAGIIPTSLPPNGTAGGDLTGSYPNPFVSKIQNIAVSNTVPANGQVLKFSGTQWAPAADDAGSGSFTLPYSSTANNASSLMSLTNQGAGSGLEGVNSSTTANVSGILGKITSTTPGAMSAGVKGINSGTGLNGIGVYGSHLGSGYGVYGNSVGGTGTFGNSTSGFGVYGKSSTGTGIYGESTSGNAGSFSVTDVNNNVDAVYVSNLGQGNGIYTESTTGNGLTAVTNNTSSAAIWGFNNSGGVAIHGVTFLGTGAGIKGSNTTNGGTAVEGELLGVTTGNVAVFKVDGANVARINQAGKGFFNGGTQNSGADIAEAFDVEGTLSNYEPGDILIISESSDRKVEKSNTAYSTLVAGVYATKPGVLLTEENIDNDLIGKVPMGVIGVIPTKVCLQGGEIKRGDLLVTSSIAGVAMKGDPDKVKVGQVLGKALENYSTDGIGKIKVLVSIK